jgi:hypothetical protein
MLDRNCFIICPLGTSDSEIRKRSDIILKFVLKPVLEKYKYNPIRADQIPKAGLITSHIINMIIESPLVIADLTGANPNVFYELAIRHAVNKPYIQIIQKGEDIPFDIKGIRTVYIDHTNLEDVENAKKEITNLLDEIVRGHIPDSPVSIATSIKLLQENDDFIEKIANKISDWTDPIFEYGNLPSHDRWVQQLEEDLNRLTDNGIIKLRDLNQKLDYIIEKFNKQ